MTIDKIDHPWGETGALDTTLTDAKRDVGWVSGDSPDKPTVDRLNLLQNETDNKFNAVIDGTYNTVNDMTATILNIPVGSSTLDSNNIIDSGVSTADMESMAFASVEHKRRVITGDSDAALTLYIYDTGTMTYDGIQAIASSSLPSDGNEKWIVEDLVCDGDYTYILWFSDSSGSAYDDDHYIQAYSLTTWLVRSGWPLTGLYLSNGYSDDSSVINANDNLLAFCDNSLYMTGSSADSAVILIDKSDGTVDSSGAGDFSTSGYRAYKICSNGTYIFAKTYNLTNSIIGSLDISNPTSGCGGSNWPLPIPSLGSASDDISCIGDTVMSTIYDNSSPFNLAYMLHVTNAIVGYIQSSDVLKGYRLGTIINDTVNFWAFGYRNIGSTNSRVALFKINQDEIMHENSSTHGVFGPEIMSIHSVSFSTSVISTKAVFDGDGIVFIPYMNNSGAISKLPRCHLKN